MKIKVPTSEEHREERHRKRRNFIGGFIVGIIFFGLASLRLFWLGIEEVEVYTWIALGFGVLSFGFLGMLFGSNFWKSIFGPFK